MTGFSKSAWSHLRIPFSLFLSPVYFFALAWQQQINPDKIEIRYAVLTFVILHLFVYPASNGFNSYFDKDEGSIGGLKTPPKVDKSLYWLSLLFDGIGLVLALYNWLFAVLIVVYGLVSKAYSHPIIRLKKYPYLSWIVVSFFQGGFTFLMVLVGVTDQFPMSTEWILPAAISSVLIAGSYPMTQIYQHKEDAERGDKTLSLILGKRGTFYLSFGCFGIAFGGFYYLFYSLRSVELFFLLQAFLLPVLVFVGWWFLAVFKNEGKANFTNTMRLNLLSSCCLIAFMVYWFLY